MARLILDTGVLVAAVRGRFDLAAVTDTDDVVIPAVVVAEYLVGPALDPDPDRAARHRDFLDRLLEVVPVRDYDLAVAARHAELLAHARRAGVPRGVHDLVVAATALATDRTVLTTDARAAFDTLPGVTARLVAG